MDPASPPPVAGTGPSSAERTEPTWPLPPRPDISRLVTEDDAPVDSWFSEKQMRLLVEPLYSSWSPPEGRPFVAAANVGVFSAIRRPPVVPDVFVSLDVTPQADLHVKEGRSYFLWEFGKPPDIVVEVVSNAEGGETDRKLSEYARMGVTYYVIFDPDRHVQDEELRVFLRRGGRYVPLAETRLEGCGLSLVRWTGRFEGREERWLRWADEQGNLLLTGLERAEHEKRRVEAQQLRIEALEARVRALEGNGPTST